MAQIAWWRFNDPAGAAGSPDTADQDGVSSDGVFLGEATTNGLGQAVFNNDEPNDDEQDHFIVPVDPANDPFDLPEGTLVIDFTQETVSPSNSPFGLGNENAAYTLFSRDSTGNDGGGHLSVWIRADGQIQVRHQGATGDGQTQLVGGSITLGVPQRIVYTWGEDGLSLSINGIVVDTSTDVRSWEGNDEPIIVGASATNSGDGNSDDVQGHFDGLIDNVAIFDEALPPTTLPCFVEGVNIETPKGLVPVENLKVGDLVTTLDDGAQPILWHGSAKCLAIGAMAPVCIPRGVLGAERDLYISRDHRVLLSGRSVEKVTGLHEGLTQVKHLIECVGLHADEHVKEVTYHHIATASHQIIFSEGVAVETFYPGDQAISRLTEEQRREVASTLCKSGAAAPVRPFLRRSEVVVILDQEFCLA